jgi:hypothetical protein
MKCYLCKPSTFNPRKGQVRYTSELKIIESTHCGLVSLNSQDHIQDGFYEGSGMHGSAPVLIVDWLNVTDWDDQRRFDMLMRYWILSRH